MKAHTELIATFYTAFQNLDGKTMAACYHPKAVFNDPAFQNLRGEEIGDMWTMLIDRSNGELDIQFDGIVADEQTGKARWEAKYTFSKSKRPVHNVIEANFEFADGQIIKHTDHFDFWKWTQMALGPMGYLLGWSSFLRGKVRQQAMSGLQKYRANKNS